ncbi:hypothetical protein WICPIJ_000822 [Wickerhamomyces pijperi]|uniref:Uncharacterized protein n=1 Tax=Wickerhamomyces pijperi TaxID=599730 RepID=A0A9P8QF96_WICPI|nr:hypothetical protein WICPIJ_000822 [Wickerhamomyces pijperi]
MLNFLLFSISGLDPFMTIPIQNITKYITNMTISSMNINNLRPESNSSESTESSKEALLLFGPDTKSEKPAVSAIEADKEATDSKAFKHEYTYLIVSETTTRITKFQRRFKSNNKIYLYLPQYFSPCVDLDLPGAFKDRFDRTMEKLLQEAKNSRNLVLVFATNLRELDIYQSMYYYSFIRPHIKGHKHSIDILKYDQAGQFQFTKSNDQTVSVFENVNNIQMKYDSERKSMHIRLEEQLFKLKDDKKERVVHGLPFFQNSDEKQLSDRESLLSIEDNDLEGISIIVNGWSRDTKNAHLSDCSIYKYNSKDVVVDKSYKLHDMPRILDSLEKMIQNQYYQKLLHDYRGEIMDYRLALYKKQANCYDTQVDETLRESAGKDRAEDFKQLLDVHYELFYQFYSSSAASLCDEATLFGSKTFKTATIKTRDDNIEKEIKILLASLALEHGVKRPNYIEISIFHKFQSGSSEVSKNLESISLMELIDKYNSGHNKAAFTRAKVYNPSYAREFARTQLRTPVFLHDYPEHSNVAYSRPKVLGSVSEKLLRFPEHKLKIKSLIINEPSNKTTAAVVVASKASNSNSKSQKNKKIFPKTNNFEDEKLTIAILRSLADGIDFKDGSFVYKSN